MCHSLQVKNFYLFSFVLIAHALLLFSLYKPNSSKGFKSNSALIVDLRHSAKDSEYKRKFAIKPQASLVSSSPTSIQTESSSEYSTSTLTQDASLLGAIRRQKIDGSKPSYPLISRRLREEGIVVVRLCVNPGGTVEKVDVLRSSGYQSLDNSALHALTKWKFSSSDSMDSKAVDCFRLPVQFTLET